MLVDLASQDGGTSVEGHKTSKDAHPASNLHDVVTQLSKKEQV